MGRVNSSEVMEASGRIRAAFTPAGLEETFAQITAAAVELLPEVRYASISQRHADGRLEIVAPTDALLSRLGAAQTELREGPSFEPAIEGSRFTAPHLSEDLRWARYAQVAVSSGIQAQAGLHLFTAKDSQAVLNLFSDQEGAFRDLDGLTELFHHQAATALDYARHIGQLQEAARSRQLVGTAVGIVMERFSLDDTRAFGFLARLSSTENIKLRVVAERLVRQDRTRAPEPASMAAGI